MDVSGNGRCADRSHKSEGKGAGSRVERKCGGKARGKIFDACNAFVYAGSRDVNTRRGGGVDSVVVKGNNVIAARPRHAR